MTRDERVRQATVAAGWTDMEYRIKEILLVMQREYRRGLRAGKKAKQSRRAK